MNHDDEHPDDPYRTPGHVGDNMRPEQPAHTPYTYDESKTVVRRFAMVGANRHSLRPVECDLDHPDLPAMVIRTNGQPWLFFEATNKRAYGERVGQADTAAGAVRELVSVPPLCPYDCPACQLERREALGDHQGAFGPYLGSLGGLDTELIERERPVVESLDPLPFGKLR